ncbi:MAG: molybdopterin-synthase adenylyltransferase MoeB [Planctomycetota bacterium]
MSPQTMGKHNEILAALRAKLSRVDPEQARALQEQGAALVDVRGFSEMNDGIIEGAAALPRGWLELKAEERLPDRAQTVVVYCEGGIRSLYAAEALERLGYDNVHSLDGGYNAWKRAGLPIVRPDEDGLSELERRRYARHLVIPEVGETGQVRLKNARVLLVGAGGLGSPAAIYLAAAGVGTIGLCDFDVVDESNLQRQILHTPARVGMNKVDSARQALNELNPLVHIETFNERLGVDNVDRIVEGFDVVLDGADNFPTRYLLNDACIKHDKPNVHGSVFRFEGQASVFQRGEGPCYRCLYPEPPPPEMAPSCAEAGVLGVLPGIIGMIQAVETIKLILNEGEPLTGRLLVYDALAGTFRELKVSRRKDCEYCGDGKEFPGYVDYKGFCGL